MKRFEVVGLTQSDLINYHKLSYIPKGEPCLLDVERSKAVASFCYNCDNVEEVMVKVGEYRDGGKVLVMLVHDRWTTELFLVHVHKKFWEGEQVVDTSRKQSH